MEKKKNLFRIHNQTPEQVEMTLLDFENRYHPYKSRWDFEMISQVPGMMTVQLVDRSFEPPRGKGQSDSPYIKISYGKDGENVNVSWTCRWKRWRRILSLLILTAMILSRIIIFVGYTGQVRILMAAIWLFWAILYGGWVLQHVRHDHLIQQVFKELLKLNFYDSEESSGEQTREPQVQFPEQMEEDSPEEQLDRAT